MYALPIFRAEKSASASAPKRGRANQKDIFSLAAGAVGAWTIGMWLVDQVVYWVNRKFYWEAIIVEYESRLESARRRLEDINKSSGRKMADIATAADEIARDIAECQQLIADAEMKIAYAGSDVAPEDVSEAERNLQDLRDTLEQLIAYQSRIDEIIGIV